MDSYKISCDRCDEEFYLEDIVLFKGYKVCLSCQDEVDICDGCGGLVSIEYLTEEDGENYCPNCL